MILSGDSISYWGAFLGGVILSFTPCVYPLIPVIAGYIGGRAGNSRLKALLLSTIYVTGIALTYSILGLLASLTGKIFGSVSSHPFLHIAVGVIIFFFGLSMFGLFELVFPPLARSQKREKKEGFLPTLFLGMSSGILVSPCTTPVLGGILFYLTTRSNILYGVTLLLVFSYGMGLILIFAGTFSFLLAHLPAAGKWMVYTKKIYSFVVMGMGIYFILEALRRL